MANYSMKCVVSLMVWTLATPFLPLAWAADDLNAVRFGEPALAYSSGSIQRSTPQDGFVNVITGSVGFLLMMSGNERLLMNNIASSALISLLLSFMLIPHYGIIGAAVATAMSVIVRNIMASYFVYRAMKIVTIPWPGFKIR